MKKKKKKEKKKKKLYSHNTNKDKNLERDKIRETNRIINIKYIYKFFIVKLSN